LAPVGSYTEMTKVQKSEKSHAILDSESRREKAGKITAILSQYVDLKNCRVLDIGTGSGFISHFLSEHCRSVVSVDVNDERREKNGYEFVQVKNESLPFPDAHFDIVVSNHVIEHVSNQTLHVAEAARVLAKGGILYLATPNKWALTDPHYPLPFISWLPRKLSHTYLWLVRGKEWDIFPLSRSDLLTMTASTFIPTEETAKVLKYPNRYGLNVPIVARGIAAVLPQKALEYLPFIPTLIYAFKRNG
jgi:ubiquinone/menaquinone biosynthesis C-methylase UbiE